MFSRYALMALLLLTFAACEPAAPSEPATSAPDTQADEAAIREAGARFSEAYMRGDVETMVALYTEDGVIFPDNSERLQGIEALRRYWSLPAGQTITHHQMTPEQITIEGDMASDYGVYEVSGTRDGEAWGPVHGKYVVVWRRMDDGAWKMHLDMWNRRPAPEAE